tara:strand:- start:1393 stop:2277 length:885 start_codon:yes stop_codon:yes gene_type:complete
MSRIRQAEIIIGPLAEYEGRGNTSEALRIYSSGRKNDLRVQFSVKRTFGGAPNRTDLIITNLSGDSRNRLRNSLTRVEISAGYLEGEGAGLRKVASGAITSAFPVDNPPDIETLVAFLDGFGGMSRGVFRKSFGPGVAVADVVRAVASSMPGVTIGSGALNISGKLGASGRTFAGRAAEILDNLSAQWGFSWSVQSGVFQAVDDRVPLATIHTLSYRDGSLRSVKPLLSGPMEIQTGVEIVGALNPRVNPGEQIRVESKINASLNGIYTAHEHDLVGGTAAADPWESTYRSISF